MIYQLLSKKGVSILLLLLSFTYSVAQDSEVTKLLTQKDKLFWKAYNECDIAGMNEFLAEDLEFYHDKGGVTIGKDRLSTGLEEGLCKTGKNYLRREVVPESVSIYTLKNKDTIYGAVITGEHLFYLVNDSTEKLDGQAKFYHLWLKKNGAWKMHRIFSFDHRPATFQNPKQAVEVQIEDLEKLTGKYFTGTNDPIIVEIHQGNLELQAMGKKFVLYPEKELSFFTKERDLSFNFSKKEPRKLTILESNNKVAEATRSQN